MNGPIQITLPFYKEREIYNEKTFECHIRDLINEGIDDTDDIFNEAVFHGGKEQLQPLINAFQDVKDVLENAIKTKGNNFNPVRFWKNPCFRKLELTVIDVFGFRDANIQPFREKYNKETDDFKTKSLRCFTLINKENRFPIEALVTDKGFYDQSHTLRTIMGFSLGIIRLCTAEELTAIIIHEIGHNIDPASVDIRYIEINVLSKYLTDRVIEITPSENKIIRRDRKGILNKLIVSGILLIILGINVVIEFINKLSFDSNNALEKIRNAVREDPDKFNRQNNSEAFADNLVRMYGLAGALMRGFQKNQLNFDKRGRIKKERDRQIAIADITLSMINDVHKTNIHRAYYLIKEYKIDLQDPNIPDPVKDQIRDDLKELEIILDWYLNKRDKFQNRINQIIYEELSRNDNIPVKESVLTQNTTDQYNVTTKERKEFKDLYPNAECILKKDKDGYYLGGGRSRSKSKKNIKDFTIKEIEFHGSTM